MLFSSFYLAGINAPVFLLKALFSKTETFFTTVEPQWPTLELEVLIIAVMGRYRGGGGGGGQGATGPPLFGGCSL